MRLEELKHAFLRQGHFHLFSLLLLGRLSVLFLQLLLRDLLKQSHPHCHLQVANTLGRRELGRVAQVGRPHVFSAPRRVGMPGCFLLHVKSVLSLHRLLVRTEHVVKLSLHVLAN